MKNQKNIILLVAFLTVAILTLKRLSAGESDAPHRVSVEKLENFEEEAPTAGSLNTEDEVSETEEGELPDASLEEVNLTIDPRDLTSSNDSSKSAFSKSYKLMAELNIDSVNQRINIKMSEPVENVISVVIIGGAGEIEHELSNFGINGIQLKGDADSLKGVYFENDWQKFELKGNKFTDISFSATALGDPGKLKVYLQHQGEIR